jgi:dolichyl-phosphate beta-glucosyltransferase
VSGVQDTQCGFKLFSRAAARHLFSALHVERWAFDVELLFLAQAAGIPLAEEPIGWQEVPGSHLHPVWSSLQIARDVLLIRGNYLLGRWRAPPLPPLPLA